MKSQTPPHNLNAEKSVLGCALSTSNNYEPLGISYNDFFLSKHQTIAAAIEYLAASGEAYDLLTVVNHLKATGSLDQIGGPAYLSELTDDNIPNTKMLKTHAAIIREASWRRIMAQAAAKAYETALDNSTGIEDVRAEIEKSILPAISNKNGKAKITSTRTEAAKHLEIIEKRTKSPNATTGLPTGYIKLDRISGGLQASELTILAGRPSMGKTALAMNIVTNVALSSQIPAFVFSLEMSTAGLMDRQYAALADLNLLKIKQGLLQDSDWPKITRAASTLSEAPIFIDESGALRITEIRSRARQMKAEHDIGLIVVDYLQLICSPQKSGNREQEISTISQNLKAMAKELNIPVLALSQLNRGLENRTNKRPQLSDLRESGAIEQDADLICFIYRDEIYNQNTPDKGLAELIIGKQRNGPTGTVMLKFEGATSKFLNQA